MSGRAGGLRRAAGLCLRALSGAEAAASGAVLAPPCGAAPRGPSPPGRGSNWEALQVHRLNSMQALASAAVPSSDPRDAVYQVEVVTGDVRGAGTAAPAVITLVGDGGESEAVVIGDEADATGFERATRKAFAIYTKDLGGLRRVNVRQLAASGEEGEATGLGWYLDRVEVTGPEGARWSFPCNAWLGKSDVGDQTGCDERNLAPCDAQRGSIHEPFYDLDIPLTVSPSALAIPHPEKAIAGQRGANRRGFGYGGEDAYFYCTNRHGVTALGVADGVYMWKEQGIDAGEFSRRLMDCSREAVEGGSTDVLRVLQHAAKRLRREGVQGSSTACIVLVDKNQGRLSAANLGDSGFMLLGRPIGRPSRAPSAGALNGEGSSSSGGGGAGTGMVVKYRSPQQEHAFGRPYQLGHHELSDAAEDAMLATMPVGPGDILVLGSDGLFDNVSEAEALEEVEAAIAEAGGRAVAPAIAKRLAFLAFKYSLDKRRDTPFSQGAREAFDMVYTGGKADDITVLCAVLE